MKQFLNKIPIFFLVVLFVYIVFVSQRIDSTGSDDSVVSLGDVQEIFSSATRFEEQNLQAHSQQSVAANEALLVYDQNGAVLGKMIVVHHDNAFQGYGGRVPFIIGFDPSGKIVGLTLMNHRETPDVVTYLKDKGFFRSWNGLSAQEAVAKQVDAISSATQTTQAVIQGLQEQLARFLEVESALTTSAFGSLRFFLSLVAILFALGSFLNPQVFGKFRIWLLVFCVVILGIINKEMISLGQILTWILSPQSGSLALRVVFILSIFFVVFLNKGFYCSYLCPYGALQEIVSKAKKNPVQVSSKTRKFFDCFGWIYFWAIIILLVLGVKITLEAFEPFSAFLFQKALLASMGIAFFFLICSFFIPRLWCVSFCPTGRIFNILKGTYFQNDPKHYKKILTILFFLVILGFFLFQQKNIDEKGLSLPPAKESIESPAVLFRPALFWESLSQKTVDCTLCPRRCRLQPGQTGFCRARKNIDGVLYSLTYGQPVALHADPIEKKPLNHVYPGTKSFSIATAGCNLRCKFCQNWEISQMDAESVKTAFFSPEEIIARTKGSGSKTIAFTYTEPTIFYEYMLDIAKLAKQEGIACVMHSAGYIEEEPLRKLAPYLKAANIDLKGFNEKFYTTFTQGNLKVVLRTLKILKEEGVWVEITNLLIPGVNDSEEEIRKLCRWVKESLGPETPIHFSRFYPMYQLANLSPTPVASLMRAYRVAQEEGLFFIYIGNIPSRVGENTFCPHCKELLVERRGYFILNNNLKGGRCPSCGHDIPGIWD